VLLTIIGAFLAHRHHRRQVAAAAARDAGAQTSEDGRPRQGGAHADVSPDREASS
jgi:hypothetical protein